MPLISPLIHFTFFFFLPPLLSHLWTISFISLILPHLHPSPHLYSHHLITSFYPPNFSLVSSWLCSFSPASPIHRLTLFIQSHSRYANALRIFTSSVSILLSFLQPFRSPQPRTSSSHPLCPTISQPLYPFQSRQPRSSSGSPPLPSHLNFISTSCSPPPISFSSQRPHSLFTSPGASIS